MNRKTTRLLGGFAATALILAACGNDDASDSNDSDNDAPATTEASEESAAVTASTADFSVFDGKTVGIISLAPGLEAVDRISAGVEECFSANGGSVQIFDAAGGTQAVQAFEQANAAGVDAIYNVANDLGGGGLDAGLAEAASGDRPVITAWGGQRQGSYSITGLEFQSAARVGQYVIDRLSAANNGEAVGTVLIANARVTPSLRQRADAFKAMVGPDTEYPDIEVIEIEVDVANPVADTQSKVEQAVQANPNVDAVLASFDSIGLGAAAALDADDGDRFVVSFNGDGSALDLIRQGSSFVATAANDLEGTATLACDLFADLLSGQTPSATTYWMDSPLVTDKNVPATGFVTGAGAFELFQP